MKKFDDAKNRLKTVFPNLFYSEEAFVIWTCLKNLIKPHMILEEYHSILKFMTFNGLVANAAKTALLFLNLKPEEKIIKTE